MVARKREFPALETPIALERFATHFNFEPMVFDATDESGRPIYHANVLMCVGTEIALLGSEMITNKGRRAETLERLTSSGRKIIHLSSDQISNFAGNALELQGNGSRIFVLSTTAAEALCTDKETRSRVW